MQAQHQIQIIFSALKTHLKNRGLTYKDVAKKVHMSESNLKRILATQTCSFDRLAEICVAAETSIFDLVLSTSKAKTPVQNLSQEAQDFFVDNFECFVFFRRLAASADPNAFLKTVKVSVAKLDSYLERLTELSLVELRKGKIHVLTKGYLQIPDNSPLAHKTQDMWIPWFFDRLKEKRNDPQVHLQIASTGLSATHRMQLHQDLKDLLERYKEIGYVDQSVNDGKAEPVGICIGIGPHRVGLF